ncbi:hypothetical protein BDP27DRAFT_1328185 [Rhodocollybia butyracea]|uniref:Uncharacterized protein n=1 Tax=Rhodocollybia butyracea TaxID=206335 RepID=A0A9P5PR36_9AGAR|nr:hypothetical protein BDP27DRAFT_1328185 [Rhodocollybia butyracea]
MSMALSMPLTSLCLSSNVEDLQPVQEFCFYKPNMATPQHEYHWGLQWGELNQDKYCGLGNISDTVNAIWELSEYNLEKSSSVHDRRRCFDVLPIQSYQYRLVVNTIKQHKQIPLFSFDPQTSTFQQFDYPYDSLPTFTLDVYPFHSIMHSCRVVSSESHYYVGLSRTSWTFPRARDFRRPGDADGESSGSGSSAGSICALPSPRSDISSSFVEYCNYKVHGILPAKRTSNRVSLWLESLPAEQPLTIPFDNTALEQKDDESDSAGSRISFDCSELVGEDDESNQDSLSQSGMEL